MTSKWATRWGLSTNQFIYNWHLVNYDDFWHAHFPQLFCWLLDLGIMPQKHWYYTTLLRAPKKTFRKYRVPLLRWQEFDEFLVVRFLLFRAGLFRCLSGEVEDGWGWNLTTCNEPRLTMAISQWFLFHEEILIALYSQVLSHIQGKLYPHISCSNSWWVFVCYCLQ